MSRLRYRLLDRALASGTVPDVALRLGSRWGARLRERHERRGGVETQDERLRVLLAHMSSGPVAELPQVANRQHYELPAELFALMLGPGLDNLEVLTADVNTYQPPRRFDRVISVEMFEHMRNWRELLRRIAGWLHDDGRLFLHVFSHRTLPYLFDGTCAAERFFTAGLMPSHELPARFQEHMQLTDRWAVSGTHYSRTLQASRRRLDTDRDRAVDLLCDGGRRSPREARALLVRWRLFLISTAEIWGRDRGDRWLVSHYLMAPRPRPCLDLGGSGTNPEVRLTYST